MTTNILSVPDTAMIQDVIEVFNTKKVGAFLVKKADEYIGIITKQDVIKKVTGKLNPRTTKAIDVMSQPIQPVDASTSIAKACILASEQGRRHLVIARDKNIVGILSTKYLLPEELRGQSTTNEELFAMLGTYGDKLSGA